jgi:ABC-type molybdate transport system permease subunit
MLVILLLILTKQVLVLLLLVMLSKKSWIGIIRISWSHLSLGMYRNQGYVTIGKITWLAVLDLGYSVSAIPSLFDTPPRWSSPKVEARLLSNTP